MAPTIIRSDVQRRERQKYGRHLHRRVSDGADAHRQGFDHYQRRHGLYQLEWHQLLSDLMYSGANDRNMAGTYIGEFLTGLTLTAKGSTNTNDGTVYINWNGTNYYPI